LLEMVKQWEGGLDYQMQKPDDNNRMEFANTFTIFFVAEQD
jgi:hypothetical protein